MELEQVGPKKPNFLLVVLISAASILVVFIVALFVLHARHKMGPTPPKDPNSGQLARPTTPAVARPLITV